MKKIRKKYSISVGYLILFALFFQHPVFAGYVIKVGYESAATDCIALTFLDDHAMKMDTSCIAGYPSALTYHVDESIIRQLRHKEKKYLEINTQKVGALQKGLQGTVHFFQGQLDRYDLDVFEKPKNKKHHYRVEKTNKRRTIEGMLCQQVIVHEDGVPVQDVWYTSWVEAGMDKSMLDSLLALGTFYESLWDTPGSGSMTASMLRVPLGGIVDLTGYPVEISVLKKGKKVLRITLGRPQEAPLRPALFSIPAGYKRTFM